MWGVCVVGADETDTVTPGIRLLADLRAQIFDGRLPPGSRMPVRTVFEKRYGTTPVTVQKAFSKLAREGLIVARGTRGTFVSEALPHLTRFALVFPYRDLPQRPWPQFWRSLRDEARTVAVSNNHELVFSYGNETHLDVEAYQQLVADVQNRRLAGLIFASKPFYLQGSPVLEAPDIPRVAIMPEPMPPHVAAVALDGGFFDQAVAHLVGRRRRRVAVVTVPTMRSVALGALKKQGVRVPSYWVQTAAAGDSEGTRSAVELLMSIDAAHRPNGLVIMDDNLVPDATAGLLDAGVRVPEEMLVVGHANFPHPTASSVPAHRMGYDMRAVLRACLDELEAQRCGHPATGQRMVPLTTISCTAAMARTARVAADGIELPAGPVGWVAG
jgi:DNA-binding LacI/PurR family transcriptional regulator